MKARLSLALLSLLLVSVVYAGWTQVKPSSVPNPRSNHGFIVDKNSNYFVFGGGNLVNYNHNTLSDLWMFASKTSAWTKLSPKGTAPPALMRHSMSYDSSSHSILIFGGQILTKDGALEPKNTLYVYSISSNTWTLRSATSNTPSARFFHNSVIIGRNMYIFGGTSTSSFLNELYVYQIDSNQWTALNPSNTQVIGARFNLAMTRDSDGQNLYVFGGAKCFGYNCLLNSLVRYNINDNSWTEVQVGIYVPDRRSGTTLTEVDGDLYVFGGSDPDGRYLNDLWRIHLEEDGTTGEWMRIETGEGPEVRNNHKAISTAGRLVVFGGHNELLGRPAPTFLNDLWEFNPN